MKLNAYFPGECRECDGYRYHLESCSQFRPEHAKAYALRKSFSVAELGADFVSLDDTERLFALCGTSRSDKAEALSGGFSTWARVQIAWTPNENGKRNHVAFLDRNDFLHTATEQQLKECPPEHLVVVTQEELERLGSNAYQANKLLSFSDVAQERVA